MSTLLLSGWTQPVDALLHLTIDGVLLDYSDHSPAEALEALHHVKADHIIAWSLGGQLVLKALAAGAVTPKHVTLIATAHQFVGDSASKGMDPVTFKLFRESYAKDPARTKERFHALTAKGDSEPKKIMAQLQHHPDAENTVRWLPWLDELGTTTFDVSTIGTDVPMLIIHGTNDAIVDHTQSETLAQYLPKAQLNSWSVVCHAPHLHDAERMRQEIASHRRLHEVA